MGDHDERQAALLNQTMDECSTSMNDCISQLTVELQQAELDWNSGDQAQDGNGEEEQPEAAHG
eukprot:3642696-Amphidinium_carterae.1